VTSGWRLGYRPELDGLRGVAIGLVLVGHTGAPGLRGAATVGVNVFFVLSGFLITYLLLEERARDGRVSLRRFYARRALRLFPALYAFLLATAAFGVYTDQPLEQVGLAAIYVTNFAMSWGAELPLVAHTWSLAMEEQFYLVWPPLLVLCLAGGRSLRWAGALCAVVLVASLALRGALAAQAAPLGRLHNGPDLGAGILLLGCLLGLYAARARERRPASSAALALVALLTLGGLSTIPKSPLFYALVIPLAGVATLALIAHVISPAAEESWVARALRDPRLVHVGKISYGLYLWHYLVYNVARKLGPPTPLRVALQVVAAVLVAEASYWLLERRFLRMKERFSPAWRRTQEPAESASETLEGA
jgi:peptidoglycan/LPS O-acetylase OafA/YrhL